MTRLGELCANWRLVAAAGLGQAAGYPVLNYINNIFTPHLIKEFGWSGADIALVSATTFLGIVAQPVAGRLTDAFGVRRVALVGVCSTPLMFAGLSAMTGPLFYFFLLSLVQVVLVGGTTTATVYSRLIAQRFVHTRGMALAIAACAAPAAGVLIVPLLSGLIDANGWRRGYVAMAVYAAVAGASAVLLIPAHASIPRSVATVNRSVSRAYGSILRNRAFQLTIAGVVLCNLSLTMQTTQLKVILLDREVDSATGSWMISLFAFSTFAGRLLCGAALDRFPTHAVAAISLGLPGLGLAILASGTSLSVLIAVAVMLFGLCLGAESDVFAYICMRYFKLETYSTVLGLVIGALALSVSLGSVLLSLMLELSGSYTSFLALGAVAALLGGGMLTLLRRVPVVG